MLNRNVNDLNTLERLRYRQGQTILSRDFRDQTVIDAQLRWWHNRAVHNAFGVAEGMDVEADQDTQTGQWRVRVDAGLAYDVFGQELVLPSKADLTIPPAAASQTLLVRYPTAPKPSDLGGVCAPGAVPGRLTKPDLTWQLTARVGLRDGVPLARTHEEVATDLETLPAGLVFPDPLAARIRHDAQSQRLVYRGIMSKDDFNALNGLSDDKLYQSAILTLFRTSPLERFSRPLARPVARPKIASGSTIAGSTDWTLWQPFQAGLKQEYGYQVDIDTSAAGFRTVPCYFAWLSGVIQDSKSRPIIPVVYPHLEEETIGGFRFVLFLPSHIAKLNDQGRLVLASQPVSRFPTLARDQNLAVCWLAIEPAGVPLDLPS